MTEKKPSRQRSYQIRNKAKGLCMKCPRPIVTKNHCTVHQAKVNKYYRERQQAARAAMERQVSS